MKYCAYVLYSQRSGSFYKGSSSNKEKRLSRHNAGSEKATRLGVPWVILWAAEKPTRSEAIKLEFKLKNLSRKRTLEFLLKYEDGIEGPDELLLLKQLSGC